MRIRASVAAASSPHSRRFWTASVLVVVRVLCFAGSLLVGCSDDKDGGEGPAHGGMSGAPTSGGSPSPGGAGSSGGAAAGTTSKGGSTAAGVLTMGGSSAGTSGAGATVGGTTGTNGGTTGTNGGTGASGGTTGTNGGKAGMNGGSSGSMPTGGAGGSSHAGTWQIMPLGDSITGTTCYPQLLAKRLKDDNKTNFQFIGSNLNNQSCNGAPNVQTEGHGGYLVTYLVNDDNQSMNKGSLTELDRWATATPAPDVLLLHYGTNDVWNRISPMTITDAYTFVLGKFRAVNPNVIVFVAEILPMHPNGCMDSSSSCENNRVKALNATIPDWATRTSTATSPIYVVDVYASVDANAFMPSSATTSDGVHPNATGSESVAKAWYDALLAKGIP